MEKSYIRNILAIINGAGIDAVKNMVDNIEVSNDIYFKKFYNLLGGNKDKVKKEIDYIDKEYKRLTGGYYRSFISHEIRRVEPKSNKPFYGSDVDIDIVEFLKDSIGTLGQEKMFLIPISQVKEYMEIMCSIKNRNTSSLQAIKSVVPLKDFAWMQPFRKEHIITTPNTNNNNNLQLSEYHSQQQIGGLYMSKTIYKYYDTEKHLIDLLKLRVDRKKIKIAESNVENNNAENNNAESVANTKSLIEPLDDMFAILIPVDQALKYCCDFVQWFNKYPMLNTNL